MGARRTIKPLTIRAQLVKMTAEFALDKWELKVLCSVPRRGTESWEAREQIREKCRCKCLSWGGLK